MNKELKSQIRGSELKPKLSPSQLVNKMDSNGIKFNIMSKKEAETYLYSNNNYFRLASYRENYDKYSFGINKGKYINLDFSYLVEMARVDMHLRFLIMKMCLDVEHCLKVMVLNDIAEDQTEDGYDIVAKFLNNNTATLSDIYHKKNPTYVGDLIREKFNFVMTENDPKNPDYSKTTFDCPIWALLEIMTFGHFLKLLNLYYSTSKNAPAYLSCLSSIRSLRNASAHNNCIIHNLSKGISRPTSAVTNFISSIKSISQNQKKTNLSRRPIYEFVCLMYVYNCVVSEEVKYHRLKELDELINIRLLKHKELFSEQQVLKSSYCFVKNVVDFLTDGAYNNNDNKKT